MLAIQDTSNKLTFDLLTLKVVFESRVTWTTFVAILVFLGLSVLKLGPMYATDRQKDVRPQTAVRQKYRLMPPSYGARHSNTTAIAALSQRPRLRSIVLFDTHIHGYDSNSPPLCDFSRLDCTVIFQQAFL